MEAVQDPLGWLRAALRTDPDSPLARISLRTSSGEETDAVASATQVVVRDTAASETAMPLDTPTWLSRTREMAKDSEVGTPETALEHFFTLGALVFAVQQRGERTGAYLRNATAAKIVPLPAVERPAILEYLLGKRETWEGVVSDATHPPAPGAEAPAGEGDKEGGVPATDAVPAKRAHVVDAADAEYVRTLRTKYEVVLLDRNDVLSGTHVHADDAPGTGASGKSSDLSGLRTLFKSRLESAKRRQSAPAKPSAPPRAPGAPPNATRRSRAQDPIILLSNSPTALVNMFNVKSLLQDGVFIHPDEARKEARGIPELVVTIQTRSDDEGAGLAPRTSQLSRRILVVDSAEAVGRLGNGAAGSSQDPWNRVIAVFTTGQTWQFKHYRWSDPRDLFKNAMGVYVRWHNDAPNPQVRDWSVTDLQVDRTKRHTDKQLVAFFWRALDSWVQRKKPHMQLS